MVTLNDIPFEVFMTYLLPLISIKEVGALSMVNTMWRDVCDDNETWKNIYMRTIAFKILDTSIHIGPRWSRLRIIGEEDHRGRVCVPTEKYQPWDPCDPKVSGNCKCCFDFTFYGKPSYCIPPDLKTRLKTYSEIRTDGYILTNQFPHREQGTTPWGYRLFDTSEYAAYVKTEWEKYNRERGISTINLCQNHDHYQFDTLGAQEGCRNYKSFKKITLKKIKTTKKHEKSQQDKDTKKREKNYEKHLQAMRIAKEQYLLAEKKSEKNNASLEKLDCAIKSL